MPLLKEQIEKIISEEMAGATLHTMEELANFMVKLSSSGCEAAARATRRIADGKVREDEDDGEGKDAAVPESGG